MLGAPAEDGTGYRRYTHAIAHVLNDPEANERELVAMHEYFGRLIEERRSNPGPDILSSVVASEIDGEGLSEAEIIDFVIVLLLGGLDNISFILAVMFWRLAWDHDLRRQLQSQPELQATAIEEFLRCYTPPSIGRLVTKEVTVGTVTMKAGDQLMMANTVMNRDPRQFENPDEFIPDRDPNRHFAFGLGIHRCLGAHLVRVQMRVALEEFEKRIPEWELDSAQPVTWMCGAPGGLSSLPIVFPPGGAAGSEG
jgi:cytochrome P450